MDGRPWTQTAYENKEKTALNSLSKSSYLKGLQCHKYLYLHKHHPELKDEISDHQMSIFQGGTDVGILAQKLFPGGVEIPFEGLSFSEQLEKTKSELDNGRKNIYEAAFSHDGVFVKVDILHKGTNGWELYEVKSSAGVKDTHYDDLTVQYYVLQGVGMTVYSANLVHINNEYTRQGELLLEELFSIVDLTKDIIKKQSIVKDEVGKLRNVLSSDMPEIDIGEHCDAPYPCEFYEHCRKHIPEDSVFTLKGRGVNKYDL